MVVIRLSRGGATKRPFYRVVVADKQMPRDGRFIEQVGTYDPRKTEGSIVLKMDRIEHWRQVGAQMTKRVSDIVKTAKVAA